jgi:hypothetical protein
MSIAGQQCLPESGLMPSWVTASLLKHRLDIHNGFVAAVGVQQNRRLEGAHALNVSIRLPDLKGNKREPREFAQKADDYYCQLDG